MLSSSSAEAERVRREKLEALKAKRNKPASTSSFQSTSPEPNILVPSSSSPVAPTPSSSKFINHAPAPPPARSYNSGFIPSSGLSGLPNTGSPSSIMSALAGRKDEGKRATNGNGTSSLSYEVSSDLSPTTPRPLGRLKARYTDDTPSPSEPKRTPSLIAVAKATHNDQEEEKIKRISAQFRSLTRPEITAVLRRYQSNEDLAMEEIRTMELQRKRSGDQGVTGNGHGSSHPIPVQNSSSPIISHAPPKIYADVKRSSKPKKNERSSIYANRGSKKKDPDDSESEGAMSEADSEMDWSGDEGRRRKRRKGDELDPEGEALKAFNEVTAEVLTGTIACSVEQAAIIIKHRPYEDVDTVRTKLTKARGVSPKLFEQYVEIMEGYVQIDVCLNRCESIANEVASTLAVWRGASLANDSVVGTPRSDGMNDVKVDVAKVSELLKQETDQRKRKILSSYIQTQPARLREGTVLKDYQLLGVNWLNLLFSKKIGCILADEMGLGKTIQVIAFIAHLRDRGMKGPHMIFVPASTLENWTREFDKFAPSIDVQTYYGSQAERASLRHTLKRQFRAGKLEVVLASYTQVAAKDDLDFFRKKIEFSTCIYDEGHKLKSCTTKAYADLLSIKPKWRLLLTGTPLQNNLQELVSLLMFIHKDTFEDAEPYLRAIFKSQGQANLLSQQRVSRARTMLTPFVLRRRKANVLSLPPKIEKVEHCDMTQVQAKLYRETMARSHKALQELSDDVLNEAAEDEEQEITAKPKTKAAKKEEKKPAHNSSHILMDLRKAASHPLLFRRLYDDRKVRAIARECLNTPTWCESNFDYVVEDIEIMSDAEIHHFCSESDFDNIRKFALNPKVFLEGGKIAALRRHIERCQAEGKRMLLFSQFVMILDILQVALDHLGVRYTRLDGQTRTDERQGLVDEFNDDEEITVFMLSTKAGGVGINLTAASVVVIFDQDFNPHNDRQAADRAYRIGQEKEVEVIKLITRNSIDEDMLNIGMTKLQLDDAVGGEEITLDGEAGSKEDNTAKEVRKSLLTTLRNKFDAGAVKGESIPGIPEGAEDGIKEEDGSEALPETQTPIKIARAARKKEEV